MYAFFAGFLLLLGGRAQEVLLIYIGLISREYIFSKRLIGPEELGKDFSLKNWSSTDPVSLDHRERKQEKKKGRQEATLLSEPGFDPGTCGLWAHHASAAPL